MPFLGCHEMSDFSFPLLQTSLLYRITLPVTSEDSPEGGPLSLFAPIHPPISFRAG
jgi:hypothetical protein